MIPQVKAVAWAVLHLAGVLDGRPRVVDEVDAAVRQRAGVLYRTRPPPIEAENTTRKRQ